MDPYVDTCTHIPIFMLACAQKTSICLHKKSLRMFTSYEWNLWVKGRNRRFQVTSNFYYLFCDYAFKRPIKQMKKSEAKSG